MSKIKHPSNRYERMKIKEIKDEHTTGRSSRLWRKTRETETVRELQDEILAEQVREEEATREERVAGFNNI